MAEAKPFLWFGCADGTLSKKDIATPRARLVRELQSLVNYMAQCDLEKANEPFVVLFSRLAPDVIRSGAAVPNSLAPSRNSLEALPPAGDVSATEFWRVKALRRAIEEARDKLNPRFVMLVSVQQPWLWTFVFLRAHDQLRPALHRLAPNAAQLLADQRQVVTPGLTILDDLTPGQEVVQRLRPRIAHELRPLLLWMGNEDMEANERVVVLYTCADVQLLRQLFIVAPEERSSRVAATGDAVGMEDLGDAELQRTLLARDRLYDVVDVLRPRLLVLINWLLDPDRWLLVLCRNHTRLMTGIGQTLPNPDFCVWSPRRALQPVNGTVADVCYSNACPKRGRVQVVKLCPRCCTAKYCSAACQAEHWKAGHCRFCPRLEAAKLRRATSVKSGPVKTQPSIPSIKKR